MNDYRAFRLARARFEGGEGDIDPYSEPGITPGGTRAPRGGQTGGSGTSDPSSRMRCQAVLKANADLRRKCIEQGKNYQAGADECKPGKCVDKPVRPCPEGKVRLSDGRCHDDCTKEQLASNGRNAAECRRKGGTWVATGRCKGKCEEERRNGDGGNGGAGAGRPGPVTTPTAREPEPYGHARGRVKRTLDRAERVTPEQLMRAAEAAGATFDPMIGRPDPLNITPPAGVQFDWRTGLADRLDLSGLPNEFADPESLARLRLASDVFDPLTGQPKQLAPHSLASVISDPRYLAAAAEQERGARRTGAALGYGGAPVQAAIDAGRRNALGAMSDRIFGQNLQQHQARLAHGQDTYARLAGDWTRRTQRDLAQHAADRAREQDIYGRRRDDWARALQARTTQHSADVARGQDIYNRRVGDWQRWWQPQVTKWQSDLQLGQDAYNRMVGHWQRWWEPTRYAHDQNLRTAGLGIASGDQALRAEDQMFRHWWLPEQQARGHGYGREMANRADWRAVLGGILGQQGGTLQSPSQSSPW